MHADSFRVGTTAETVESRPWIVRVAREVGGGADLSIPKTGTEDESDVLRMERWKERSTPKPFPRQKKTPASRRHPHMKEGCPWAWTRNIKGQPFNQKKS